MCVAAPSILDVPLLQSGRVDAPTGVNRRSQFFFLHFHFSLLCLSCFSIAMKGPAVAFPRQITAVVYISIVFCVCTSKNELIAFLLRHGIMCHLRKIPDRVNSNAPRFELKLE